MKPAITRIAEKILDGGWALGTGNSVTNYIPAENLLVMLEEGFAVGRY